MQDVINYRLLPWRKLRWVACLRGGPVNQVTTDQPDCKEYRPVTPSRCEYNQQLAPVSVFHTHFVNKSTYLAPIS